MKQIKVLETTSGIRELAAEWKKQGLRIGLVPTMGYLHEGHGSLVKRAVSENDRVIVSDFVNPIQFGPSEDLESYPRDFEADAAYCQELGADAIFHPSPQEMYAEDFSTYVEVSGITEGLCGAKRPGHFRGVCTVVSKLFHLSMADRAYFGQKDAQQLAVVRRMVRDLNFPIEIIGCPIVREADGLAKSSRNTYLNEAERKAATVLHRALEKGRQQLEQNGNQGEVEEIKRLITAELATEPLARIDYVEIVSWDALSPVTSITEPVLAAIAVYIGRTRLIDNFIIESIDPSEPV